MEEPLAFGSKVKDLRKAREWSQRDLTEACPSLTQPQLSRIERNKVKPTAELIAELAAAFGETPAHLCAGTDAEDLATTIGGVSREAYDNILSELLVVRLDLDQQQTLVASLRHELDQMHAERDDLREQLRLAQMAARDTGFQLDYQGAVIQQQQQQLRAEQSQRQFAELQRDAATQKIMQLQHTLRARQQAIGSTAVAAGGLGALIALFIASLD